MIEGGAGFSKLSKRPLLAEDCPIPRFVEGLLTSNGVVGSLSIRTGPNP